MAASSSVNWNWKTHEQAAGYLKKSLPNIAKALLSPGHCGNRLMGLPYVLAETGIELLIVITSVAEPLIKGLGNIGGSICNPKCNWFVGITQIFLDCPSKLLVRVLTLPYILIAQLIKLVTYPFWAAIDPGSLLEWVGTPNLVEQCLINRIYGSRANHMV